MEKVRMSFRSLVAMALCALLAMLAFLGFLVLMASSRGAWVLLGLTAALACPVIWLSILLSDSKSQALDAWVGAPSGATADLGASKSRFGAGRPYKEK